MNYSVNMLIFRQFETTTVIADVSAFNYFRESVKFGPSVYPVYPTGCHGNIRGTLE